MSAPSSGLPHLRYIDCLRGYAVLMVIACHLAYEFPGLPYPVKRLVTSGWFGVQLFFLASCLTLLMSWHSELRRQGTVHIGAFFLRRYFRIAPAYYAAGLLYFWLAPPTGGFDAWQAIAAASFLNAWHPAWTPTVQGIWGVVPGGWSISVEFAFYAVFPVFATVVTSLRRAVVALLLSLAAGVALNRLALGFLAPQYAPAEVANFLFFWFPNQASVFAIGGIVYFIIRDAQGVMAAVERHSRKLACGAVMMFCAMAWQPLGKYLGDGMLPPAGLAVCLPLALFILALSCHRGALVSRPMAAMGQVSFSAYLLHFAVLQVFTIFPDALQTGAQGMRAIIAYAVGFVIVGLATYAASALSYRVLELPMIALGKKIINRRRCWRQEVAASSGAGGAGAGPPDKPLANTPPS